MLNLKITAVILFHDEKLEDLLKTINSAKDEVDDIYIITTTDSIKKLKEENIVIIKDNLIENDFSSIRNKNKKVEHTKYLNGGQLQLPPPDEGDVPKTKVKYKRLVDNAEGELDI